MKKIGFTIGKFAPFHKGHEFLIETAIKEMDEFHIVIYDTDLINVPLEKRANWIKEKYPNVNILYAYNSPKQIGLDKESVKIQMEYLNNIIFKIPVTHFYSSELYGEKVSEFLKIKNRIVDINRIKIPISAKQIRKSIIINKEFLSKNIYSELKNQKT